MSTIAERIERVSECIAAAAQRSGRSPETITLVAITKTHDIDVILEAYQCGLRHFGENRVQEAIPKIQAIRGKLPPDVTWHMVGYIQSRKANNVVTWFDWVHSVDRLRIAQRLSQASVAADQVLPVLLEVNLSGEATKHGYDLSGWPDNRSKASAFWGEVEAVLAQRNLLVEGLMTMPPLVEDPEEVRPIFRKMRALQQELAKRFPQVEWRHLSMGMSGDYEVAIEEGATMIRLGTALFGPRKT